MTSVDMFLLCTLCVSVGRTQWTQINEVFSQDTSIDILGVKCSSLEIFPLLVSACDLHSKYMYISVRVSFWSYIFKADENNWGKDYIFTLLVLGVRKYFIHGAKDIHGSKHESKIYSNIFLHLMCVCISFGTKKWPNKCTIAVLPLSSIQANNKVL